MMTGRSTAHATFTIERDYPGTPAQIFAAWADPRIKRRWFAVGDGFIDITHTLDFRRGGREHWAGREPQGRMFTNETVYHDIVPNCRIVFSYTMDLDEARISASLTTVEMAASDTGTLLLLTEQCAFFEDADTVDQRRGGWTSVLGRLGEALDDMSMASE